METLWVKSIDSWDPLCIFKSLFNCLVTNWLYCTCLISVPISYRNEIFGNFFLSAFFPVQLVNFSIVLLISTHLFVHHSTGYKFIFFRNIFNKFCDKKYQISVGWLARNEKIYNTDQQKVFKIDDWPSDLCQFHRLSCHGDIWVLNRF